MQEYTTQRKAAMHFFPIEIIYQGSLYSPKKHFFFCCVSTLKQWSKEV